MPASYNYVKLNENMEVQWCPYNDIDGKITGHIVLGLKAWFDENPEERKRLGWIKVIDPGTDSVKYDRQREYLTTELRHTDEYTVEKVYRVMKKSEQQLLLEELLECVEVEEGIVWKIGGLEFL